MRRELSLDLLGLRLRGGFIVGLVVLSVLVDKMLDLIATTFQS